jgi:hypothetical protein
MSRRQGFGGVANNAITGHLVLLQAHPNLLYALLVRVDNARLIAI